MKKTSSSKKLKNKIQRKKQPNVPIQVNAPSFVFHTPQNDVLDTPSNALLITPPNSPLPVFDEVEHFSPNSLLSVENEDDQYSQDSSLPISHEEANEDIICLSDISNIRGHRPIKECDIISGRYSFMRTVINRKYSVDKLKSIIVHLYHFS